MKSAQRNQCKYILTALFCFCGCSHKNKDMNLTQRPGNRTNLILTVCTAALHIPAHTDRSGSMIMTPNVSFICCFSCRLTPNTLFPLCFFSVNVGVSVKLMLAAKSGHSLFCFCVILKHNLHTRPARDFPFPSFSHI